MRFSMPPQVVPDMASWGLLRFEINMREAALLGVTGAGVIFVSAVGLGPFGRLRQRLIGGVSRTGNA